MFTTKMFYSSTIGLSAPIVGSNKTSRKFILSKHSSDNSVKFDNLVAWTFELCSQTHWFAVLLSFWEGFVFIMSNLDSRQANLWHIVSRVQCNKILTLFTAEKTSESDSYFSKDGSIIYNLWEFSKTFLLGLTRFRSINNDEIHEW